MLRKTLWRSAILLFVLTMLIFFVVQFFFKTQDYFQISDYQYILSTSIANAFVVTVIYAIVAATNMLHWNGKPEISFSKIFKLTFIPGFFAGLLSICAIFAYFHYVDSQGIEQLKTEYLDYSLVQAKANGEYDEVAKVVNSKEVRATDLLTFRTFTLILAIMIFFNLSLALMITFLWKIRNTPTRK